MARQSAVLQVMRFVTCRRAASCRRHVATLWEEFFSAPRRHARLAFLRVLAIGMRNRVAASLKRDKPAKARARLPACFYLPDRLFSLLGFGFICAMCVEARCRLSLKLHTAQPERRFHPPVHWCDRRSILTVLLLTECSGRKLASRRGLETRQSPTVFLLWKSSNVCALW